MLTTVSPFAGMPLSRAPPYSTSFNAFYPAQCNAQRPRFHTLGRKPSEQDLRDMFLSQHVGGRKRRWANPAAFDQSWRTKRTLSVQCDIREESPGTAEESQTRKRSRTVAIAAHVFNDGSVLNRSATATEPSTGSAQVNGHAPKEEEKPLISKDNSALLRFVAGLRASLDGDETLDGNPHVKAPSKPEQATVRHDSVVQPDAGHRKRRHSFHSSAAARRELLAARAEIIHVVRTRNMSRPEISLRREIYFQEQYLRTHPNCGGSRAWCQMAAALTRNRRHLIMYRRRGSEWRDLPVHVRKRIWALAAEMEGRIAAMPTDLVAADEGAGQAEVENRENSDDADWVNVVYDNV